MQAFPTAIQPHAFNLHGLVEHIQPSDAFASLEFAIFCLRPAGLDWPSPRCHCANRVRHIVTPDMVRANFTILLAPGIEQHRTGKHQVFIPQPVILILGNQIAQRIEVSLIVRPERIPPRGLRRIGVIPLGFDDFVVSIDVCLGGHAADVILNLAGLLAQGGGKEVLITARGLIVGIIG
ncbi:hypothetical protein D3C79_742690 [compost metagenome]